MSKDVEMDWDLSDFLAKAKQAAKDVTRHADMALYMAANELLSVSTDEVPHDLGYLQASGNVSKVKGVRDGVEYDVGYYTPYAARLHEHPEYRFQKGRKGKFLEDPLKNNTGNWQDVIGEVLKSEMGL